MKHLTENLQFSDTTAPRRVLTSLPHLLQSLSASLSAPSRGWRGVSLSQSLLQSDGEEKSYFHAKDEGGKNPQPVRASSMRARNDSFRLFLGLLLLSQVAKSTVTSLESKTVDACSPEAFLLGETWRS
jgi:hypothetical protein